MWFGVAPAPAPSPRTNTKAWHPPHCTCARHSNGGGTAASSTVSSPRAAAMGDGPNMHASRTPRGASRRAAPGSLPEFRASGGRQEAHSPSRKATNTSSIHSPRGTANDRRPLNAIQSTHDERADTKDSSSVAEAVLAIADDATQRVRRLSRRLSKRHSDQSDNSDVSVKAYDRPERDTADDGALWERDNNAAVAIESQSSGSSHARSRVSTATGSSQPLSGMRSLLRPLDVFFGSPSSPPSTPSVLAVPAPTRSRRGSRGSHSRSGALQTRGQLRPLHAPIVAEDRIHLASPMVERAQPANLVGHTSSVGVVLVDDDSFIVSCSIDGSVKVWSRATLDCLYTLYGHDDAVSTVDLSSRWLVSGSHDTTLRVYESSHGFRFVHSLEGHSGHVTRVVLLSDQHPHHLAISCSDDASLRLWDVERGHCVAVFEGHSSRVTSLLVLPAHVSRGVLCSGSADAGICFWDLAGAMSDATLTSHRGPSHRGSLKSFRVHKTTVQCLLSGAVAGQTSDTNSSMLEDLIFSCSNDGTIQWFETRSLQHLGCVDSVQSPVYSMAVHPSLGFLVCSTGDGRLLVYSNLASASTNTGSAIAKRELKVAPKWISSLQLLRGRLLACVSEDDLYIVNLERPRIERVLATAHGFLNCVRWLKPEKLATSGEDNVVKIWSIY